MPLPLFIVLAKMSDPIQIVFTASHSWVSRAIRWLTHSPVSHVAIGGLKLAGVEVLLHASLGGVQITHLSRFYANRTLYLAFRVQDDAPHDLPGAVRSLGEHYDYVGLLGHLLRLMAAYLGWSIKRPLTSPTAMVCSELVARLGLQSFAMLDPEKTEPKDLLAICLASSEFLALPPDIS